MAGWITELTNILGVELTLGTTSYTLGGIALGSIILYSGVRFFKSLKGGR
jgi:hypothetical protein